MPVVDESRSVLARDCVRRGGREGWKERGWGWGGCGIERERGGGERVCMRMRVWVSAD